MASLRAESLFNLALNKLCYSMDKDTLQKILNEYPPSINLLVIWKVKNIILKNIACKK